MAQICPYKIGFGILVFVLGLGTNEGKAQDLKRPNVLFIAIDDLRPHLINWRNRV